jgi:hypothetical protein
MSDYKRLCDLGWKLTPVVGKKPILKDWGNNPVDPADYDLDFGVILGESSGIIDVECDSQEATDALLELLDGELPKTTSWKSTRGTHLIFRWTEGWPGKAVVKFRGIEFRVGNTGSSQSVLPPSGGREWIHAPWDVEPQEFLWQDKIVSLMRREDDLKKPKSFSEGFGSSGESLNVRKWLDRHGVEVFETRRNESSTKWFIRCPGFGMHTTENNTQDCAIFQDADGKLGAKCFHQSCGMADWQSVSAAVGTPDWLDYLDEAEFAKWGEVANTLWPSKSIELADEDGDADDVFCEAMIPPDGLIREIYECYLSLAIKPSPILGLATALSVCQALFGRKIASHTDIRTNDYNVVLAPTGSGKEACETTVAKIFGKVDTTFGYMMPSDVQSGNGLIAALSANPCRLWVADEFGKVLSAVLDKKGNQHLKNIGIHLLKLYNKASGYYSGAAHAEGIKNAIVQPHLCILGLTTPSTLYVGSEQVNDGLLGRIAFWPVSERPKPIKGFVVGEVRDELVAKVKAWIDFAPGGNLDTEFPKPSKLYMTKQALDRWEGHQEDILARMDTESEVRAAIWSRVAGRAMALSLVHRASRAGSPEECGSGMVEIQDVNWGVKLANWLGRVSCGIVQESVVDNAKAKAKAVLLECIAATGKAHSRSILRANRTLTKGDLAAAASELGLQVNNEITSGRPRLYYSK